MSAIHDLKTVQPYFDAVAAGDKTFEVRKNDRGYQAGDIVHLWEFKQSKICHKDHADPADFASCPNYSGKVVSKRVTYVYSGDPRFGGIEPGCVVLALGDLGESA